MLRLILLMLFISATVLVATALMAFVIQTARSAAPRNRNEDAMPKTFRNIAYVLLVVLMFGVVTGWLGAA